MDEQRERQQLRTDLVKLAVEKMGAKTSVSAVKMARDLEAYIAEATGATVERRVGFVPPVRG